MDTDVAPLLLNKIHIFARIPSLKLEKMGIRDIQRGKRDDEVVQGRVYFYRLYDCYNLVSDFARGTL